MMDGGKSCLDWARQFRDGWIEKGKFQENRPRFQSWDPGHVFLKFPISEKRTVLFFLSPLSIKALSKKFKIFVTWLSSLPHRHPSNSSFALLSDIRTDIKRSQIITLEWSSFFGATSSRSFYSTRWLEEGILQIRLFQRTCLLCRLFRHASSLDWYVTLQWW